MRGERRKKASYLEGAISTFLSLQQADGAEHGGEDGGLGERGESGVADEAGEKAGDVVTGRVESIEDLDEEKRGAQQRVLRESEIGDVKLACGAEDARDFTQSTQLVFARQVMEDETRENMIERCVGKRQRERHGLLEVDGERSASGFGSGHIEDLRIGIDGGNARFGIARLKKKSECAGAASEIEEACARQRRRLGDEARLEGILAESGLNDEVVPRRQRAIAQRGDVSGIHERTILRQRRAIGFGRIGVCFFPRIPRSRAL